MVTVDKSTLPVTKTVNNLYQVHRLGITNIITKYLYGLFHVFMNFEWCIWFLMNFSLCPGQKVAGTACTTTVTSLRATTSRSASHPFLTRRLKWTTWRSHRTVLEITYLGAFGARLTPGRQRELNSQHFGVQLNSCNVQWAEQIELGMKMFDSLWLLILLQTFSLEPDITFHLCNFIYLFSSFRASVRTTKADWKRDGGSVDKIRDTLTDRLLMILSSRDS